MADRMTESVNDRARGLDLLDPGDVLALLAAGQQEAARAVDAARGAIAEASRLAADAIVAGGKLVYAGAGSSGLMAMADALELPGTYGIANEQIAILLAGGVEDLLDLKGEPEDDVERGRADAMRRVSAGDCVIVVSASGGTPYAVAVAEVAKARGARVIAIANNAGARLFDGADVQVLLATPPEMIAGSTRMGAGTAQKIALNMLSTSMAIRLGHVHDGHMVNLRADNSKLRARAARMVSEISGVAVEEAARLVEEAAGSVKTAILMALGADDRNSAEVMLRESGHNVRRALGVLGGR